MSSKASATASVVIFLSGTASGHLVAWSTRVKMYQCPASLRGAIGPTMSIASLLNGVLINGIDPDGTFLTITLIVLWYTSQERQNLMMSLAGQKKFGSILTSVFFAPR